jgi:hypothetical protein
MVFQVIKNTKAILKYFYEYLNVVIIIFWKVAKPNH